MKTTKIATFLAVTGIIFLFASCSETLNSVDESIDLANVEKSEELTTAPGDSCTFTGTLTEAEITGLMRMREEEKLAHDVYVSFFGMYEYVVFNNISKSESAHTSAVLYLINGYGLTDPTPAEVAVFSDPLFTGLYEQLTENGSVSLVEALKTGAFIEEYDIADLEELIEETQNEDLIRVYSNLLRGSKFHLKAFTGILTRMGETYTPTILTPEQYAGIVNGSDTEETTEPLVTPVTPVVPGICDGTGPNF